MSSPIHVLYVDDDPAFSNLTATVLEREARLTVATATGGRDALDYLSDHDVDCVVSDYDMPRMNGIELLESVRETAPRLPFILFTGKGSEEIAAEAVEADVSGYLQKGGTDTFELLAKRVRKEVTDSRVTASYGKYEAKASP
jgi:DNA-binding NtrC family response regulator